MTIGKSRALAFKVERFEMSGCGRCLLINVSTKEASLSASVYEAAYFLSNKSSRLTVVTRLQHVAFLYSWASENAVDIERFLLSGEGLIFKDVCQFGIWLEGEIQKRTGDALRSNYIRQVFYSCKVYVMWFVRRYSTFPIDRFHNLRLVDLVSAHNECWESIRVGASGGKVANDLTDAEICRIEDLLSGMSLDATKSKSTSLRNYLIWRLALTFGLRIGEVLALNRPGFSRHSQGSLRNAFQTLPVTADC